MLFGLEHGLGILHALGMAIVHSFWQTLLLWGIYQAILHLRKNAASGEKHNLAIAFVLGAFIWFGITFFTGIPHQEITNPWPKVSSETPIVLFHPNFIQWGALIPYLSLSYLVLLVFFLFRLCRSYFSAKRILYKELYPSPDILQSFLDASRKHSGVKRKVTLWISKHIMVPGTIGFLKPIILLPVAALNHLSQEQLEAIILHELSHIRRNDYIINLLLSFVEVFLFFNPFIYLWMKAIRRERENSCDDFVLKRRYDAVSYARTLMQLATLKQEPHPLSMGAVSGNKQLLHRIVRITGGQLKNHHYRYKLLSLGVVALGILITFSYLVFTGKSEKNIHSLSLNSSLQNGIVHHRPSIAGTETRDPILQEENNLTKIPGDELSPSINSGSSNLENQTLKGNMPEEENREQWKKLLADAHFSGQVNRALQQAQAALQKINWESISKEVGTAVQEIDWKSINREINAVYDSARYLKLGMLLNDENLQQMKQMEGAMKEKQQMLQSIQEEIEKRRMNEGRNLSLNKKLQMEIAALRQYELSTDPHTRTVIGRIGVPYSISSPNPGTESYFNTGTFQMQIDSLVQRNLPRVLHQVKVVTKILRRMDI